MLSQDSGWLLNTQELFSQENVQGAKQLLSEAITQDQSEEDLFSTCCMRASLAAMEGESSAAIANILQSLRDSTDKHTLRLYLEGVSSLSRGVGSTKTAELKFDECLRNDKDFVLANLGLAAVYFRGKQYKQSFGEYRKVLQVLGDQAPSVCRVGLGLCAFYLRDVDRAQACLQRALDVDGNDVFALLGTLLLNVHTRNLKGLTETLRRLRALAPDHVVVVQKLADLSFAKANSKGQCLAAKAMLQSLIRSVLPHANTTQVAYAKFQEGRLLHATGDLDEASNLLSQAIESVPDFVAARVHFEKVQYARGNVQEAVAGLEYLDSHFPASKEVVTMLAAHATQSGHHEAAMEYSRRLGDLAPADPDSWALAAWCHRLNEEQAQLYMSRYCSLVRQQGKQLPVSVRVNQASFETTNGTPLEEVLKEVAGPNLFTRESIPVELVPAIFNLAMMLEGQDVARARAHYQLLVKHFPLFAEPYLRLHELALQAGNRKQALSWLSLLRTARPEDPISCVYEARMFSAQKDHSTALSLLMLAPSKKTPPVALAFASLYLKSAQLFSSKAPEQLKYAHDRYLFALKKDPSNLLAAHGIACCNGIRGDAQTAQMCLQHVAGLVTNDPYVVSNLRDHLINVKIESDAYQYAAYLLSMQPNKTQVQLAELAFCMCIQDKFDEGIALLEESIQKFGESNETIYNMVMVCSAAVMKGQAGLKSLPQAAHQRLLGIMTKALLYAEKFTKIQKASNFENFQEARQYLQRVATYTFGLKSRIDFLVAHGDRERRYNERKANAWKHSYQEQQEALQREEERRKQKALEEEEAQRKLHEQLCRNFAVTSAPDGFAEDYPLADDGDLVDERNENGKRPREDGQGEEGEPLTDENYEEMASLLLNSMQLESVVPHGQDVEVGGVN